MSPASAARARCYRKFWIRLMPSELKTSWLFEAIRREGRANFSRWRADSRTPSSSVRFARSRNHFAVGAAGYPEGHIESPDKRLDWDHTAAKVEAGAEFLLTQLFYQAEDFLEFEHYLRHRRGVRVPIVPGILPFLSTEQIQRFTKLCGAKLPTDLNRRLEFFADDDESVRQLGVEVCTDLCRRLLDHGVPGLHIYCLNCAASCGEILRNLGLSPVVTTGNRSAWSA